MISHLNDVRTFKTKIAAVGLFEMDVVSTLWIRIDFPALFLEFSPINTLYTTNFTEPLSYQASAFLKLPKFP